MAIGTLLGTLGTAALSAGVSAGASRLFGGGGGSTAPAPVSAGINAGGLSGANGTLTADANRTGMVRSVADQFGNQADALGGLRARLAPGFSDLRASRLAEVENARTNAIGNLRENMARRRVLGSSFGQDALTRAEVEFGQQRDKVAAESLLQEIEGTQMLINQEFEARRGQFQTGLDELNLQADIATKLAAGATAQMGANARLEAELKAKEAAGAGRFFGQTFQPVANEVGRGISSFFNSGSSSPASMLAAGMSPV